MRTERVSVVMPAWNAERYIEEALQSILDQTVRPAAIVVVDDGSTDGTGALAASLDPSITVLRRDHAGIGDSRTAGVAATTGEFVAFLDADDLWLPEKVERQVAVMDEDRSIDAVFCHLDEFCDPVEPPPAGTRSPQHAVPAALTSTALLRRSLLERLGPFASAPVGEWASWWAQARAHGVAERFVPEVLTRRRLHASNNSHLNGDHGRTLLAIARAHNRTLRARREGA